MQDEAIGHEADVLQIVFGVWISAIAAPTICAEKLTMEKDGKKDHSEKVYRLSENWCYDSDEMLENTRKSTWLF